MNDQTLLERITTDSNLPNAKLMIRNRQISVEQILGGLAAGETFASLLEQYPGLEIADIQACLAHAQKLVWQAEQLTVPEPQLIADLRTVIPQLLEQIPYLKLLVLFGSRARGDHDLNSDWDFAFSCDEELRKQYEQGGCDYYRIWGILQQVYQLGDDQIDVVDMRKSLDLLAHHIAKDGQILYELEPGEFERFRQQNLMSKAQLRALRQKQQASLQASLEEFRQ